MFGCFYLKSDPDEKICIENSVLSGISHAVKETAPCELSLLKDLDMWNSKEKLSRELDPMVP